MGASRPVLRRAREKASGEDVIALCLDGALEHVGHLAFEIGIVVRLEGEAPDPLPARASRREQTTIVSKRPHLSR